MPGMPLAPCPLLPALMSFGRGYEQQAEGKRGELTYAHRFCRRLLRRPRAGWRQRVLRGGCGSQVETKRNPGAGAVPAP